MTVDNSEWGPAMAALTPLRRAFVIAMLDAPLLNYSQAYRRATTEDGQQFSTTSNNAVHVEAHKLAHNPLVLAAYHEEASKRLQAGALVGASVLIDIAKNEHHKDQLSAAKTLLNRIGLHEKTEHKVTVERPTDDIDIKRQIVALAKDLGWSDDELRKALGPNADISMLALPAPAQPFTIDAEVGEFVEIENSTEGLEDVL